MKQATLLTETMNIPNKSLFLSFSQVISDTIEICQENNIQKLKHIAIRQPWTLSLPQSVYSALSNSGYYPHLLYYSPKMSLLPSGIVLTPKVCSSPQGVFHTPGYYPPPNNQGLLMPPPPELRQLKGSAYPP